MSIQAISGFLIILIATFVYLPENVVCQLDDICDVVVTENEQTFDNNKQNKIVLTLLADGIDAIRNIVNP